jgi:signal transduction histidine kinase/ActR/RegA family two-component response regulator
MSALVTAGEDIVRSMLGRLLVIVAVSLLPALGFQIWSEAHWQDWREGQMRSEVARLAVMVRAEQLRIVEGAQQVLTTLVHALSVQELTPDACRRLLSGVMAVLPRYLDAAVIGPDGHARCQAGPLDTAVDLSSQAWFRSAIGADGFVIGEHVAGASPDKSIVHMASAYRDGQGAVAGIVVLSLSLDWWSRQLTHLPLPPSAAAVVADRNGIILARFPFPERLVGRPLPDNATNRLRAAPGDIWVQDTTLDGVVRLAAFVPPSAAPEGLIVGVSLDRATAFPDVKQDRRFGSVLVGAGAVAGLLLTVLLGTRLIRRPVAHLLRTAERWRTGDLAARTGWRRDRSEFGSLGAAFDDMAASLEARERALRIALESTTDNVIVVDRGWRIRFLNANARAMLTPDRDVLGQVLWEAFPAIVQTQFGIALRRAMETAQVVTEHGFSEVLRRDLEVNAYPSLEGLTVFTRDVTEERRLRAALEESEARLRMSQEAGRIGSWDRDLRTGKLHWSDLQCRQFGVEPGDMGRVRYSTWRRAVHPEDLARVEADVEAAMAKGSDFETEYRIVMPDGIHWMNGRGQVILDADGTPVRLVGIDSDVTERRVLEDRLRRLTASLESRVRDEMVAREAAQQRAAHAERVQALGQLAGGIAHDFNNVLQAMSGAIRLIERKPDDQVRIQRLTRLATEAAERGASVTRRLLAFSRRADLRAEPIDLPELFGSLRELLSHTLGAGIEVQLRLEPDLVPVIADKGQLETVLVNLATNARDAMPEGGRLVLSAAPVVLTAEAARDLHGLAPGRYVRLMVTDHGTGMDAATLARAGEPFFTTKELGVGTGLGLPMAKGFAEQSGGALRIESSPGRGTSVLLWLPEAPGGAADPQIAPVSAVPAGAVAPLVLLVDDEALVREVLSESLTDSGYRVISAASGPEALRLLDRGAVPDALITDLSMADMDGLAVIRAVQQRFRNLPAILLTGYATDDAALAMGGAMTGVFSLLRKPVTDVELLDRLQALLAARQDVND